jgi:hypothetical protein
VGEIKDRLRLDEERIRMERDRLIGAEESVRRQEERLRTTFEQLELQEGRYQTKGMLCLPRLVANADSVSILQSTQSWKRLSVLCFRKEKREFWRSPELRLIPLSQLYLNT